MPSGVNSQKQNNIFSIILFIVLIFVFIVLVFNCIVLQKLNTAPNITLDQNKKNFIMLSLIFNAIMAGIAGIAMIWALVQFIVGLKKNEAAQHQPNQTNYGTGASVQMISPVPQSQLTQSTHQPVLVPAPLSAPVPASVPAPVPASVPTPNPTNTSSVDAPGSSQQMKAASMGTPPSVPNSYF